MPASSMPAAMQKNSNSAGQGRVMAAPRASVHGEWSSSLFFILAATGSAVGLGNLWRFPYLVGDNGGGAFVVIYLLCILLVGLPIMMAEIMIGRRGRHSPINSLRLIARDEGLSPAWQGLGWLGVAAGFMILSFYSVVGGWALYYGFEAFQGGFRGIDTDTAGTLFEGVLASPGLVVLWHSVFLLLLFGIVAAGVKSGLQRAVTWLMPLLFLLLLFLVLYGALTGGFAETLAFMFQPDFSVIDGGTILTALGQAFFTLSLGMGAIMVYGAYLPSRASIPANTLWIVGMDTLTAIIAGLAIFPIVFSAGMEPGQGPGLVFVTLPVVFGEIMLGTLLGMAFFVLLSVAAITSGISLLEPAVAYLTERGPLGRAGAAAIIAFAIWLLGIAAGLSLNVWADVRILPFADLGIFDLLEFVSNDIMLPLGGLLIAVFAAWRIRPRTRLAELGMQPDSLRFRLWLVITRFVAPLAVVFVFLNALGLFG